MNKKRLAIGLSLAFLLLSAGSGVGIYITSQPRCCLTFANVVMWQAHGYFPGQTTRQVEDLVYARCYEISCQWQPELGPGGCPSQYGVEQVAASWGMPGYVNPPQWDWAAVLSDAQ